MSNTKKTDLFSLQLKSETHPPRHILARLTTTFSPYMNTKESSTCVQIFSEALRRSLAGRIADLGKVPEEAAPKRCHAEGYPQAPHPACKPSHSDCQATQWQRAQRDAMKEKKKRQSLSKA